MILSWSEHIIKSSIHYHKKTLSLIISKIKKRVSSSSPSFNAGMTLEGCLVVPLFLFFMMTILMSLEMVRLQSNVFEALHQAGTKACMEAYAEEYGKKVYTNDPIWEAENYLSQQIDPYLCVLGGKDGIHISKEIDEGENLILYAIYTFKPFVNTLPIGRIQIKDQFYGHRFIGYQSMDIHQEECPEKYVYITKTGNKYHQRDDCSYLRVAIATTSLKSILELRNPSGERYTACELCKPSKESILFYTTWGNRYHSDSNCIALKRTVYIVPLSEVGARSACSKCGGE